METRVVLDGPAATRRYLRQAIGPVDRRGYGLRLVFCDVDAAVVCHVHVEDLPAAVPDQECLRYVWPFVDAARQAPGTGLVLAVVRPGPTAITEQDRRWYSAAHRACADGSVRVLGAYVVGRRSEREIRLDDAL